MRIVSLVLVSTPLRIFAALCVASFIIMRTRVNADKLPEPGRVFSEAISVRYGARRSAFDTRRISNDHLRVSKWMLLESDVRHFHRPLNFSFSTFLQHNLTRRYRTGRNIFIVTQHNTHTSVKTNYCILFKIFIHF